MGVTADADTVLTEVLCTTDPIIPLGFEIDVLGAEVAVPRSGSTAERRAPDQRVSATIFEYVLIFAE